jgi:hypothetical protein
MDDLAGRFAREARQRSGLRYSVGLKRMAVEYAVAAERDGRNRRQIAESLGLCEATLQRWRKHRPSRSRSTRSRW